LIIQNDVSMQIALNLNTSDLTVSSDPILVLHEHEHFSTLSSVLTKPKSRRLTYKQSEDGGVDLFNN